MAQKKKKQGQKFAQIANKVSPNYCQKRSSPQRCGVSMISPGMSSTRPVLWLLQYERKLVSVKKKKGRRKKGQDSFLLIRKAPFSCPVFL